MTKLSIVASVALSLLAAAELLVLAANNVVGAAAIEIEEAVSSPPKNDPTPVLCSRELNAYCPPNTTCCPRHNKKKSIPSSSSRRLAADNGGNDGDDFATSAIVGYSCLMSWSSRVPQGPCCGDDGDYHQESVDDYAAVASTSSGSGCAVGYTCAAPISSSDNDNNSLTVDNDSLANEPHCKRDDSSHPVDKKGRSIENEYERMPRYNTCTSFAEGEISEPYGLPVPLEAADYAKNSNRNGQEPSAPVMKGETESMQEAEDEQYMYMGKLAYLTNMGPLVTSSDDSSSPVHKDVVTAVVGIHGSGRDAGSYLCSLVAAMEATPSSSSVGEQNLKENFGDVASEITSTLRGRQRRHVQSVGEGIMDDAKKGGDILVIAPWFLSPADGEQLPHSSTSSSDLPFLRWVDDAPIAHTFRYGAESISVPIEDDENGETEATISSYGAMDVLLETLCDRTNYPNLERIVVAGHSAGGQFVHRWGLSSSSWCFGDGELNDADAGSLPSVRLVAANPRSYTYLDKRRYLPSSESIKVMSNGDEKRESDTSILSPFDEMELRPTTKSERNDCEEYNRYCWGLEDNPDLPAPYIMDNLDKLSTASDAQGNDNTNLFCRYATRDIVYLSGERDTKQLGNQICHEDGYQGPSRRERSERFYASLQVRGEEILSSCRQGESKTEHGGDVLIGEKGQAKHGFCSRHFDAEDGEVKVHGRTVVRNVGHDHALIFQSAEGRGVLGL